MSRLIKTLLIFLLLVTPTVATAGGFGDAPMVSVTIGDDIYSAGALTELQEAAPDDAYLVGAVVTVAQEIENDLVVAGSSVTIAADIGDDLRAAGSLVTLTGTVGDDAVLAGGMVNVASGATVAGSATLAGGAVSFSGDVTGDLEIYSDEVNFAGTVGGDVTIRSKKITIAENAKIGGKLTYFAEKDLEIPEGVASEIERKVPKVFTKGKLVSRGFLVGKLFGLLVVLVAGAVLLASSGKGADVYASNFRKRYWRSLIVGALLFAVPLVVILLLVTAVGALLGAMVLLAWILALISAAVLSGYAIGSLVWRKSDKSYGAKLLTLIAGALIIAALGFVPLLGGAIQLVIFVLSLGSIALSKFELYKEAKKAKLV
ncbi:MAG: hypothetical protein ABIH35_04780 [Patescibacteria group bacterium]